MTVPIHAVMLINPAMDTSAPIVGYIIGQAAPSILSGKPSEIKDIYMTTNKSIETIFPPNIRNANNGVILSIFYQGESAGLLTLIR